MPPSLHVRRCSLARTDHTPTTTNGESEEVPQMTGSMRAVVYTRYGSPDVLESTEVEKPVAKGTAVLIKVHATSVAPLDVHLRGGTPLLARMMAGGLRKPTTTILGFDIAGEIESTGDDVRRLREGDQVYGVVPRGINGANAEYVCVPEENVIAKPGNLTYEEAAAVPTAATVALLFLRAGAIRSGQRVLVNGASGGLGTCAVQIAKSIGTHVTAMCSTTNVNLVRSLGADEVIDYATQEFTENGQTYDLIFDAVGKSSFTRCRRSLNRRGVYVSTVLTVPILLHMLWTSIIGSRRAKFVLAGSVTTDDLNVVNDLVERGELRPVIDRCYPLSQVAEAHRYAELGHAKGRVVVTVPE